MSTPTISENLFELLCSQRSVKYERIPEGVQKTADYRVLIDSIVLITEIKQLEPNDADKEMEKVWGLPDSPGAIAPAARVQGLIKDAYPQIKKSSEAKWPTMVVLYNNSGPWNWIDTFTISKAMFGLFSIKLGLQENQEITVIDHGYRGKRAVTKDSYKSLSAVGVLDKQGNTISLDCYHNPFATIPLDPLLLTPLADAQYKHPNPHARGFVPWEPKKL